MRRTQRKATAAPLANGCNGAHANGHTPGVNGAVAAMSVPVAKLPAGAIPPATADRGEGGRFTPGNKGGPGNPFTRAIAVRRKALLEAITPEDVASVARKLRELALAGDTAAAKVLLSYVVGKPVESGDPDRVELEAFKLLMEYPDLTQLTEACRRRVSPAVAAEMAEARAPATLAQLEAALPAWADAMEEEAEERACLR